jgi:hypothetical protein
MSRVKVQPNQIRRAVFLVEDFSPFLIRAVIFAVWIRFEIRLNRVIVNYDRVQDPYKRKPNDPRFWWKPTVTLAHHPAHRWHWYTAAYAEPTALRASLESNAPIGGLLITKERLEIALTNNKLRLSCVTIASSHRSRCRPRVAKMDFPRHPDRVGSNCV